MLKNCGEHFRSPQSLRVSDGGSKEEGRKLTRLECSWVSFNPFNG